LGIGANAAIFTLVNAVLLKNLPVVAPATLYRLGDNNACCINGGIQSNAGDYTYFATDSYEQFKKNTPELAELAAMQAGFGFQPIIARREGPQTAARSAVGEFVSGNYFRTFGLQPAAGRRHPHGARGGARRSDRAGVAGGDPADGDWAHDWDSGDVALRSVREGTAL
jgi:macrolide transport system ATP-binding/permease protein